jgi:predicted Zn-dependent protease
MMLLLKLPLIRAARDFWLRTSCPLSLRTHFVRQICSYRFSRKGRGAILILVLLPLSSLAALPDLNQGQSTALSWPNEVKMGRQYMMMLRQQIPLVHDPVVLTYVQDLGHLLASHSPRPNIPFEFFVVNSPVINAFALPGGHIGIHSGLMLMANSEDELAAVMAHEIAHVTQRHIARQIALQQEMMPATIGAMILGAILATQAPSAGVGAITAAQSGAAQASLHFSRAFETEADNVGKQILIGSGFSAQGMTTILRKLLSLHYEDNNDAVLSALTDHPEGSQRVAESWDVTHLQVITSKSPHAEEYNLIRARLIVDTDSNPIKLVTSYETWLKTGHNDDKEATRYTYALALLSGRHADLAEQQINLLIQKYPDELFFKLTQADILNALHKTQAANQLLEKLYDNQPDYYPVALQYANFCVAQQNPQRALAVLADYVDAQKNNPEFLTLLARAEHDAGSEADAYQLQARIMLLNGQIPEARAILQIALDHTHDPLVRAKIMHQLESVNAMMKTTNSRA